MPDRWPLPEAFQQARCPQCDVILFGTRPHALGCCYLMEQAIAMQNANPQDSRSYASMANAYQSAYKTTPPAAPIAPSAPEHALRRFWRWLTNG